MEYIHTIIDFFANGKSEMKVYFFIFFLVIVFLFNLYFKNIKISQNKLRKTITIFLFLLFALNFSSFLFFFKSNDISIKETIYVYSDQEISSSNILHNHTLKSPIGYILNKVNIDPVQKYVDTGYAFTSFYSPIFINIILIMFLILSISIILYSNYIFNKENNFLKLFIYVIFSFSILKNIFDGGFFHTESILAITGFLIIINNNNNYYSERKNHKKILIFFLIHLLITIFIAFNTSEKLPLHGFNFMSVFLEKFIFFSTILAIYYHKQINKVFLLIAILPLFSIISFKYISIIAKDYQDKITEIQTSQQIIFQTNDQEIDFIEAEEFIDFNDIKIIKGYVKEKISKKEIIEKLDLNNEFYSFNLVDVNCNYFLKKDRVFTAILNKDSFIEENNLFKINLTNNELLISENSCVSVNPSLLNSIFKKNNINKIILIVNE